jgi:hypothetical protein
VYSHFPTQNELLQGCTAHVIAKAPTLPIEKIQAATDLPTVAKLLMLAMEQQHLHFEPWLCWREDRVIPFLAEMVAGIRQANVELVEKLLVNHNVQGRHRELAAAWESMLSFDVWHRMVRQHQLPIQAVRRIIIQCLLAIVGATPISLSTPSPRRKS